MTIRTALPLFLCVALAPFAAAAQDPSAMTCPQLWYGKNAILKARGVCFTDPRAIRTFGNEGCTVRDPNRAPLTPADRERMARIVLAERIKLCR